MPRSDEAAKQARVDGGGAASDGGAPLPAEVGAAEGAAPSSESAPAPSSAEPAAAAAEQPQPAAAAEEQLQPVEQPAGGGAGAESAPSDSMDVATSSETQPVDEPAAAAAGPSDTDAAAEAAASASLAAAAAPAAAAAEQLASTTSAQPAGSMEPMEKPAAVAMLLQVDTLLKKELAFLRATEEKFGTLGGANGGKPTGARKPRAQSRSAALVEPLSMEYGGGASLDSNFRSPRTPKPNSRWTQPTATQGVSVALKPFVTVLDRMMKHRDAAAFVLPVEQLWSMEMLPGYHDVVKQPMDLSTIKTKLNEGMYGENPEAFAADVRLVWKNCMTYNNPDTDFHHTADRMRLLFEQAYVAASQKSMQAVEKERQAHMKRESSAAAAREPKQKRQSQAKPKQSRASKPKEKKKKSKSSKKDRGGNSSFDAVQMMNDNLQRVLSRMEGGGRSEPKEDKVPSRTMELWEKERLVKMMDKLEPDKFGTALSIIKQSHRVNLEEVDSDEEVTIDIDTLDSKTLWKLHKYVEDNIPKKRPAKKKMSAQEKQRQDRNKIEQRAQKLNDELSQLQGNLAAAAAGSDDSSSSSSSSDSDSD